MNKPAFLRLFRLLLPAVILTALGCVNPDQLPIFYTLETEDPVDEDRGLPEDLHAIEMVNTGSRYFLAAGSLFTRLPGTSTRWAVVPPPEAGALCNTIEVWDPDGAGLSEVLLYAGWFDQDGNGLGLWSIDATAGSWSASDWTQDANLDDGERIGLLQAVKPGPPSEMLVASYSGSASYTYVLHYYLDTSYPILNDGGLALVDSSAASFTDASYDGTNYWVVAGRKIYTGAAAPLAAPPTAPSTANDSTAAFGGVFAAAFNEIYVSTKGATLFLTTDGGTTWENSGVDPVEDSGGEPVPFGRFVDVDASIADELYVGTRGFGYYVIPSTGSVAAAGLQRKPLSNISGLYYGAVNGFLLDTGVSPDSLFVCTSGSGLWRGDFTGSDWTWKQEKSD